MKCWYCKQIIHPLDDTHSIWCGRVWAPIRIDHEAYR